MSTSSLSQSKYTVNGYFSTALSTDHILISRGKSPHHVHITTKEFQIYSFLLEFQNLAFVYKMLVNYSHAKLKNLQ